jgi:hypothetical protein
VPTPFDHISHSIRDLVEIRPRWPNPVQHRVRRCDLTRLEERGSPRENLPRVSEQQYHTEGSVRTSQAITPKLYISLALVGSEESGPPSGSSRRIHSGTMLRGTRPALIPPSAVEPVEWGRMDALPRPAMRALPSSSTRMFV